MTPRKLEISAKFLVQWPTFSINIQKMFWHFRGLFFKISDLDQVIVLTRSHRLRVERGGGGVGAWKRMMKKERGRRIGLGGERERGWDGEGKGGLGVGECVCVWGGGVGGR